jgi:hypothetical protein
LPGIRKVHGHHTNIIALDVRGHESVKCEFRNLAAQQEAGELLVVGIFFNDLERGGRLAEHVPGQSPFLQAAWLRDKSSGLAQRRYTP